MPDDCDDQDQDKERRHHHRSSGRIASQSADLVFFDYFSVPPPNCLAAAH